MIKLNINESYAKETVEELYDKLNYLKSDFKNLSKCDTLADIKNIEWQGFNFKKIIERKVNSGIELEDVIDNELEHLYEIIKNTKDEIESRKKYDANTKSLFKNLYEKLNNNYNIISNNDTEIIIKPNKDSSHADCIKFVDDVVKISDGKYNFTGRGGSWTAWDIVSSNGIRLKAGWADDLVNWFVHAE